MSWFLQVISEICYNSKISPSSGQPTYGFPQVKAEIAVINASWKNKQNTGLADSVGLMVYQGTQALNYVKNYAHASKQWSGFPIKTDVPKNCILLGAKGTTK